MQTSFCLHTLFITVKILIDCYIYQVSIPLVYQSLCDVLMLHLPHENTTCSHVFKFFFYRLKVVIDAMQQRKQIEKQIEVCEKKKLWIEYQDLREKVVEYTNDKKEAVKLVNSHKSKMEPLEKVIEKAKSGISKLEQQKLNSVSSGLESFDIELKIGYN